MPSRITVVGSFLLLASSECDDCLDVLTETKSWSSTTTNYTPAGTTPTTTPSQAALENPYTGMCELGWARSSNADFGIASVCFDGEYGDDMIADVEVNVPCTAFGGAAPPNTYEGYENDNGNNDYMVQTSWSPWLCNVNEGVGTWWASFPPGASSVCNDYTLDGVNYVVFDEFGFLGEESPWGPDCPFENQFTGYYASLDYDLVPSGTTDCTPGSAEFKLATRAAFPGDGDEVSAWLTPLATEDAHFPERAWLRRVKVLDWGSAGNLHVARLGDRLSFDAANVSNGRVLTPGATNIYDFAVGAAPMSAMLGTAHLTVDEELVLPTVELHWSCQVDGDDPHFEPIAAPAYSTELPAATGFEHDIVLWVDWPNKLLRIAPEGRFSDAVRVPLFAIDATSAGFAGTLPSYDMAFKGELVKQGTNVALEEGMVAIGSTEFELDDRVLTPL